METDKRDVIKIQLIQVFEFYKGAPTPYHLMLLAIKTAALLEWDGPLRDGKISMLTDIFLTFQQLNACISQESFLQMAYALDGITIIPE